MMGSFDRASGFPGRLKPGPYLGSLGLVAAAVLIAQAAQNQFSNATIAMLLLLAVLLSASVFGALPGMLGAGVAGLAYNFFFLAPTGTFAIRHGEDVLAFAVFFAVALITGWLVGRVRQTARQTLERSQAITKLLSASRDLGAAATVEDAASTTALHLSAATDGPTIVLLPGDGGLTLAAGPADLTSLSPSAAAAAERAWTKGELVTGEDWQFSPLEGLGGRVGVVGQRSGARLNLEPIGQALIQQGALAIERATLSMAASENLALRRARDLQVALLNSVSHDFRTPLATVLGSSTTLLKYDASLKPSVRRDLLESIAEEAKRLNRYVGDLLDMGRVEGRALTPKREATDARVVCEAALSRLDTRGRQIVRRYADRLSLVQVDPILVEQAVLNVLENALAHSPDGAPLSIAVEEDANGVLIAVDDQGCGIPPGDLGRVFEPFHRVEGTGRNSSGLGLSIARGFIEAVGGRIAAVSPLTAVGGSRFLMSFPKQRSTPAEFL